MIYGIVDLGSNTIRLLVYKAESGVPVQCLMNQKYTVGLAAYVEDGKLSDKGVGKACEVLLEYKGVLQCFDNSELYVFATASLRNISNTRETVEMIRERTGLIVDVLSGEMEAALDFSGAVRELDLDQGLMVDIGGGSTELVAFKQGQIQSAVSMPFGSLGLYKQYVGYLTPTGTECDVIRQHVLRELEYLDWKDVSIKTICGVGGTIRAVNKLYNELFSVEILPERMPVSYVREIIDQLSGGTKTSLFPILQVVPDRVHTILPGAIALDTIAEYFHCGEIWISNSGVREGYLYEKVLKG